MSETPTGWAAPVLVPGAMAKISQARAMKKPAEADLAPLGPTKAATGVLALTIFSMISRIEVSSPPGVSRVRTTRSAPSRSARSRDRTTYSAVMGWMGASTRILTTEAEARTGPEKHPKDEDSGAHRCLHYRNAGEDSQPVHVSA